MGYVEGLEKCVQHTKFVVFAKFFTFFVGETVENVRKSVWKHYLDREIVNEVRQNDQGVSRSQKTSPVPDLQGTAAIYFLRFPFISRNSKSVF